MKFSRYRYLILREIFSLLTHFKNIHNGWQLLVLRRDRWFVFHCKLNGSQEIAFPNSLYLCLNLHNVNETPALDTALLKYLKHIKYCDRQLLNSKF